MTARVDFFFVQENEKKHGVTVEQFFLLYNPSIGEFVQPQKN